MSHLATLDVGRRAVEDGSLQSLGETLLPRFLWVATLLVFTRGGQPCVNKDNSLQVFVTTKDAQHMNTPLRRRASLMGVICL